MTAWLLDCLDSLNAVSAWLLWMEDCLIWQLKVKSHYDRTSKWTMLLTSFICLILEMLSYLKSVYTKVECGTLLSRVLSSVHYFTQYPGIILPTNTLILIQGHWIWRLNIWESLHFAIYTVMLYLLYVLQNGFIKSRWIMNIFELFAQPELGINFTKVKLNTVSDVIVIHKTLWIMFLVLKILSGLSENIYVPHFIQRCKSLVYVFTVYLDARYNLIYLFLHNSQSGSCSTRQDIYELA